MAPTPRTISAEEAVLENQDLQTRILIELPAKPLIQFKVVARPWLSLISNPEFASRHTLLHHPTKPSAFFVSTSGQRYRYISSSKPTNADLLRSFPLSRRKVIQSCNGLVLLSSVVPTDGVIRHHVCNPTTSKITTLPLHNGPKFYIASLAFDPLRSPHYKVIGISRPNLVDESPPQSHLHVYSSESGEWQALGSIPTVKMVPGRSAYFNGGVYWISYDGSGFRFDIDQQLLTTIPSLRTNSRERKHLYVTNGHLQLAQTLNIGCIVWEIRSDYSRWSVKYTFVFEHLVPPFPEIISVEQKSVFTFLQMVEEDDEKKGPSMWFHVPDKVVSYDVRERRYRVICDLAGGFRGRRRKRSMQFGWHVHPFIESLALV